MTRFIAWRFLLKATERGTFSPMTLFAWLAIGVGVGAMSSLLSVMYGFEGALRSRILNAYPHVLVLPPAGISSTELAQKTELLENVKLAERVQPFLEAEMVVQSPLKVVGAVVRGVPESKFKFLEKNLVGKLPSLKSSEPQVVLGNVLAERLDVGVGSSVKIISPTEKTGPLGTVPKSQSFSVSGVFESGHYEFDQQYLFAVLEDVQDLTHREGNISGWHLWARDLDETNALLKEVTDILPANYTVESWEKFNSALFQSLKLEQYAMFTIFSGALAIAVLNVIITLMMYVTHKRKNIGILRALGASKSQIRKIFLWQGLGLGGVGLVIGAAITFVFVVYVKYFSHYELPAIYYDRTLPVEVRPLSLALIYGVATLMIFLSTIYPSRKASDLNPIEAIRE